MLAPFKMLRTVSQAPIIFQSIPAPMASIAGDPAYAHDPCSIPGLVAAVRPIFDAECEEAGNPELYTYVPQPPETIDQSGLTKDDFIGEGVGFGAFNGRSKGVNVSHGNQKYGALVMADLLGRLREFPGLQRR